MHYTHALCIYYTLLTTYTLYIHYYTSRCLGILKWTHTGTPGSGADDPLIPLKVNCWPDEESRGVMNISIEYTKDIHTLTLSNVYIKIPLGTSATPTILTIDGNYKHNSNTQELIWDIPLIDHSNNTGTLEFTINTKNNNTDAFFPITVSFESIQLFVDLDVQGVKTADGSSSIVYGIQKSMSTEEYVIE